MATIFPKKSTGSSNKYNENSHIRNETIRINHCQTTSFPPNGNVTSKSSSSSHTSRSSNDVPSRYHPRIQHHPLMISKMTTRNDHQGNSNVNKNKNGFFQESNIDFSKKIPKVTTIIVILIFVGCSFLFLSKQVSLAVDLTTGSSTKESDMENIVDLNHLKNDFSLSKSQSQSQQPHQNNGREKQRQVTDDEETEYFQLPMLTFWIKHTEKSKIDTIIQGKVEEEEEGLSIIYTLFDTELVLLDTINATIKFCYDDDGNFGSSNKEADHNSSVGKTFMISCRFLEYLKSKQQQNITTGNNNDLDEVTEPFSSSSTSFQTKEERLQQKLDSIYRTYYDDKGYSLYINWKNYHGNRSISERGKKSSLVSYPKIFSISYWNEYQKQHMMVNFVTELVSWSHCNAGMNDDDCPIDCQNENKDSEDNMNRMLMINDNATDENNYLNIPKYRRMWDPIDHLCKPTNPLTLPPKRSFGGVCSCYATCHTKEATYENTSWPWKTQQEYEEYHPPTERYGLLFTEKRKARRKRRGQKTAYRFICNNNNNNNDDNNGTTTPKKKTSTSTSSSSFKLPTEAYGDFQHHLFFIPEGKLILCGIPKVGSTEWIKFHRYVMGAKDYLSYPHSKSDRHGFYMQSLNITKAEQMLADPSWTKAVFFRNPAERLISAYRDKIIKEQYTHHVFKLSRNKILSFEEFIDLIAYEKKDGERNDDDPRGLHSRTDPHWKSQVMTCGLDYILPQFDFIGTMENIAYYTKELLQRVNLWDEYGSTYTSAVTINRKNKCWVKSFGTNIENANTTSVVGFNQQINGTSISTSSTSNHVNSHILHATGAEKYMKEYFSNPELLQKVRKIYELDYAIWDEINDDSNNINNNNDNNPRIFSGHDLKVVQNYCSSLSSLRELEEYISEKTKLRST